MNLSVDLKNCYGINSLVHSFDFGDKPMVNKSYAIYAPNGTMKSSFARTFLDISNGEMPRDERFNKPSEFQILVNGARIAVEEIYVVKSELNITEESKGVTDILVNPEKKNRYDQIIIDLGNSKSKAIAKLSSISGVTKKEVEATIIQDFGLDSIEEFFSSIKGEIFSPEFANFKYSSIFYKDAINILKNTDFVENARRFTERYESIFQEQKTIYKKGIFNPAKADTSIKALKTHGFFQCGHKVFMDGDDGPIDGNEFEERIKLINSIIDNDESLKAIKSSLSKNAETKALTDLIEGLSAQSTEFFLEKIQPENIEEFRKDIWRYNAFITPEVGAYSEAYDQYKDEIKAIEEDAARIAPSWENAVSKFNARFVKMPFTLSVDNLKKAALGLEKARLKFIFKDEQENIKEFYIGDVKTLSQGEKRALYLLNFIFDVESRIANGVRTFFIVDDIADSFDYKNKHAIIEYLKDIDNSDNFYQIVLTHNYDFFRNISKAFVSRKRCLMTSKSKNNISLIEAGGIENYFKGVIQEKIDSDDRALLAAIPFTRNLIEYTKPKNCQEYLALTSMLHFKEDSNDMSKQKFYDIYNNLCSKEYTGTDEKIIDILFSHANQIAGEDNEHSLNLENKILMSIAIRLSAEKYLIGKIRELKNEPDYWCEEESQFGYLMKTYKSLNSSSGNIKTLERIRIAVSDTIHLNSFMYEPILDLSTDYLVELYKEVSNLAQ